MASGSNVSFQAAKLNKKHNRENKKKHILAQKMLYHRETSWVLDGWGGMTGVAANMSHNQPKQVDRVFGGL